MKKILIIGLTVLFGATSFSQTFNTQRMDSLFHILEQKEKFMGSIAVSQNGKLLYTKAIGYSDLEASKKATTATKYRIGSISKMFTAALILKAVEENKTSLTQTLDRYFPQIENSKKITIGNLLNHRSGIHNFTNDDDYLTYNTVPKSEKEMLALIAKGKSDFEPNSKGEYSNSNYVLLSYILEKIYKEDFATVLNTKIIKPLGLKDTYFGGTTNIQNNESYSYSFEGKWNKETETDMSIPMGAGSLVSNPTDLAFFIEQLFVGKIISSKSLALMKTMTDNYGMGMFEFPYFEKKSYGHTGGIDGFQSVVSYFPEEKLAIALTSNGVSYTNNNVLLCALSSYFNRPFEIPTFKSIEVSASILNSYLGQYASPQIPPKISITQKDNQLFAQATGQSAFPLEATSDTVFKFEQAGVVLEFNSSKSQMTLKQGGKEFLFTKE
jgi:D-alanyl-D-alanine carboxypeptidase